jgi:hypothetical protein
MLRVALLDPPVTTVLEENQVRKRLGTIGGGVQYEKGTSASSSTQMPASS